MHLYGYRGEVEIPDDRTLDELDLASVRYGKFDFLSNWGEPFNGYKCFLMRPSSDQIPILSRQFPASVGLALRVGKMGVLDGSQKFVRWFEAQEARLRGPVIPS